MGINAFSTRMCLAKCLTHKRCEIEWWFQRTTYRNRHIASLMATWPMTSRDPKRSRLWPDNFEAQYLNNPGRQTVDCNWPPIGNHMLRVQWSRDRWRHMPPNGHGRDCTLFSISKKDKKDKKDRRLVQIDFTNRKPHIRSPMVTWPMTSLVANGDSLRLGYVGIQQRL